MKTSIATLPPTAHCSIIRKTLERERNMRRYARISSKDEKVAEITHALESLDIIEAALREKGGAA